MFMREKDGTIKPLSTTNSEEYAKEFASNGRHFGYLIARHPYEIADNGKEYKSNFQEKAIKSKKADSKVKPFEIIRNS